MTRFFIISQAKENGEARRQLLDEIATLWGAIGIIRLRIFFAGQNRLYLIITARRWTTNGVVQDAAGILFRDGMSSSEVSVRPSPQKRFTGGWKIFTVADVLLHFARTTWPEQERRDA